MARQPGKPHTPDAVHVDVRGLEADLRAQVDGEVRFDRGTRALYATDASNYRQVPLGVVLPRSAEAAVRAVDVCHDYKAPLLARGAGTSLAGQGCNVAVVLDFTRHLNRILEIDPERRLARVEPGLILDRLRDRAEAEHGLTFGPDPATHDRCTFGGMLGNNACGIHSVMAGRTVDNVQQMEILTYDGLRLTVGATSDEALKTIIETGGRRGHIYAGLRELRDRHARLIRDRYPRIPRRVSGYNLDELLPENGFNVARALVGSESTCVTILEATVALVPSPPHRALLVLGYPDVYHAGDHVPEVMEHRPVGLEGLDDNLVRAMKLKRFHGRWIPLLPEGGGWLLVEFGGETPAEAEQRAREAMAAVARSRPAPAMKLFTDREEMRGLWQVRESGLGAAANVPTLPLTWPGWEDAAVPPAKVGAYLRDFRKLLDEHGYVCALYGHFGQGCIHCRISFDLQSADGIRKYVSFAERAADLVVGHGGSLSGEHGDGQARAALLPRMFGDELVGAFEQFKLLWDPSGHMNPGKVVRAFRPDENLRLGAGYAPRQTRTHFRFPADEGSLARATLRCVGVGKCRRTERAFMCPSFLVTGEERDTTRGRAHLLFEMMHGGLIDDGWRSREVLAALDLCLGCKGCKTECPTGVDIATWKAEFLAQHYRRRPRPRAHHAMGLIEHWAALGSRAPNLANLLSCLPGTGSLVKWAAGISTRRPVPVFARQRFTAWYAQRRQRRPGGGGGDRGAAGAAPGGRGPERVVLYPDVFNDHFFPETLRAGLAVLECCGFQVELPPGPIHALRPLIHYGLLGRARTRLRRTLARLRPVLAAGLPIVVLEPSTASVFRDELPELLPGDEDGGRLTAAVRLLGELLDERGLEPPPLAGRAIYHAHCHEKAVLKAEAARRILRRMGLEVEEPQEGCCGMAGSFGMEKQHHEISLAIGELALLPAVRRAPVDTWVIADGFSCRMQIQDATERRPLHLAELLQEAFRRAEERPAD